MTLSGPSIEDPPIIEANYLDHPDDVRTLVEGVKYLKKFEATEAFEKQGLHLKKDKLLCGDVHQGCNSVTFRDLFTILGAKLG